MGKFGLTQEALEEGLREVDKNGKIKYFWENMEHVTTRGKGTSSQQVENRTGTDKDANCLPSSLRTCILGCSVKVEPSPQAQPAISPLTLP